MKQFSVATAFIILALLVACGAQSPEPTQQPAPPPSDIRVTVDPALAPRLTQLREEMLAVQRQWAALEQELRVIGNIVKTNQQLPPDAVLSKIELLRPVQYYWNDTAKEQYSAPFDLQRGFVAQEYMEVFPEDVWIDPQGFYNLDQQAVVPVLVKAIQELNSEIKLLKEEISKSK